MIKKHYVWNVAICINNPNCITISRDNVYHKAEVHLYRQVSDKQIRRIMKVLNNADLWLVSDGWLQYSIKS